MKYKFNLWTYTPIDVRAAEAELNRMAKKGYAFRGIGGFPEIIAVYEKSDDAKRKYYAVDYNRDESEERKEERKVFFKGAGWQSVYDGNGYLCIYMTDKRSNVDIYSDIETRLEGIERAVTLGKNTAKALRGCVYRIVAAVIYLFNPLMFQKEWGLIWAIVLQALIIIGIIVGDIYKIISLKRIKKNYALLGMEQSTIRKTFNLISTMATVGLVLCFLLWAITMTSRGNHTMGEQIASTMSVILFGLVPVIGIADILSLCFEITRDSKRLQMTLQILTIGAILLGGILIMVVVV